MNTIPNFSTNKSIYINKNNQNNSNVNFQGLNLRKLIPNSKVKQTDWHYEISYMLGIKPKEVVELTKGASEKRLCLLSSLTEKFNYENFHKPERMDSQKVINIFQNLKKPKDTHFLVIKQKEYSIDNVERLFNAIGENSNKLNFVHKFILSTFEKTRNSQKMLNFLPEIIESKHSEKYISNFKKIESYLSLNKDNPNMIKNLDEMFTKGAFNAEKYDRELAFKKVFNKHSHFAETENFNMNIIGNNFSKKGLDILEHIEKNYGITKSSVLAGNDKDLLNIYRTTTKENINLRKNIFDSLNTEQLGNFKKTGYNEQLGQINILFGKIDENKHTANFVQKLMENNYNFKDVKELNSIIETIPPKKLDIFSDNVINIINDTRRGERVDVIQKEIENPFYMSKQTKEILKEQKMYGFKVGDSFFTKTKKFIVNQYNKVRYMLTANSEKSNNTSKPVIKMIDETKNNLSNVNTQKPEIIINKPFENINDSASSLKTAAYSDSNQSVKPIVSDKKIQTERPAKIVIKRTIDKVPNAKKLVVINDVNNIIAKKLSINTLDDQKATYLRKATKMRLSFLPEIFDSIKETRKSDRLVGKKKSLSSNKDALELYQLINGKNKKLVNYMLKKRNSDGSRMFEVKNIIDTLENARKQVVIEKAKNPNYKAADAKEFYNNLHNSYIEKYGNLSKTKHNK